MSLTYLVNLLTGEERVVKEDTIFKKPESFKDYRVLLTKNTRNGELNMANSRLNDQASIEDIGTRELAILLLGHIKHLYNSQSIQGLSSLAKKKIQGPNKNIFELLNEWFCHLSRRKQFMDHFGSHSFPEENTLSAPLVYVSSNVASGAYLKGHTNFMTVYQSPSDPSNKVSMEFQYNHVSDGQDESDWDIGMEDILVRLGSCITPVGMDIIFKDQLAALAYSGEMLTSYLSDVHEGITPFFKTKATMDLSTPFLFA